MQDIKVYNKLIITLKSGAQHEILVDKAPNNLPASTLRLEGFIALPIIRERTLIVDAEEIAAIEITKEPHILYNMPDNEVDLT